MIRTKRRGSGESLIADTPALGAAERETGGRIEYATAGHYDGAFQVNIRARGKNHLGVTEVTHRTDEAGETWSFGDVVLGATLTLPIGPDGQARPGMYYGKYGMEAMGPQDAAMPSHITADYLASIAQLPQVEQL